MKGTVMYDVIIPCLNEEATIGPIVSTFRHHPAIQHIVVVVDDRTTDKTADAALNYGLGTDTAVLYGPMDGGKGENIQRGLRYVTTERVILCDGDLSGFMPEHIDTLTRGLSPFVIGVPDFPYQEVLDQKPLWVPEAIKAYPWVSGERVMLTKILRRIELHGYLAEVQINDVHKALGIEPDFRFLQGLYSPFRMGPERREAMERDRAWGKVHGVLS
jgi:glycosyltransferase involved in cell wall biosynthesis